MFLLYLLMVRFTDRENKGGKKYCGKQEIKAKQEYIIYRSLKIHKNHGGHGGGHGDGSFPASLDTLNRTFVNSRQCCNNSLV